MKLKRNVCFALCSVKLSNKILLQCPHFILFYTFIFLNMKRVILLRRPGRYSLRKKKNKLWPPCDLHEDIRILKIHTKSNHKLRQTRSIILISQFIHKTMVAASGVFKALKIFIIRHHHMSVDIMDEFHCDDIEDIDASTIRISMPRRMST